MGGGAHADVGVEAAVDGEVVGRDVAQVAFPDHVRLRSSSGGSAMSPRVSAGGAQRLAHLVAAELLELLGQD